MPRWSLTAASALTAKSQPYAHALESRFSSSFMGLQGHQQVAPGSKFRKSVGAVAISLDFLIKDCHKKGAKAVKTFSLCEKNADAKFPSSSNPVPLER